jgi:hypothetical protein
MENLTKKNRDFNNKLGLEKKLKNMHLLLYNWLNKYSIHNCMLCI